jgi:hypothetical protein
MNIGKLQMSPNMLKIFEFPAYTPTLLPPQDVAEGRLAVATTLPFDSSGTVSFLSKNGLDKTKRGSASPIKRPSATPTMTHFFMLLDDA